MTNRTVQNKILTLLCTAVASAVPQNPATPVPSFDLNSVKYATGDFSERRVIGEGGFAVVYQVRTVLSH